MVFKFSERLEETVDKHRIYEQKIAIEENHTKTFFDMRAKNMQQMVCPYMAVLLGDQEPKHSDNWNKFEKKYILPKMEITSKNAVLDIGCGIGRWAESVIPLCGYYYGSDFSSQMIKTAKERIHFKDCQYEFKNESFQALLNQPADGFKRKFDRLIIDCVCMYINDADISGCYQKLLGLLDEHAILYFVETVAISKRITLSDFYSSALQTNYDAIYRTPEEYNAYYDIFTRNGFQIKEQNYLPHDNQGKEFYETDRLYTILEK